MYLFLNGLWVWWCTYIYKTILNIETEYKVYNNLSLTLNSFRVNNAQ